MRKLAAGIILCLVVSGSNFAAAGEYQSLAAGILALYCEVQPTPAPPTPPAPQPGICANCNGTGKLGDGTITVTCPVCKGTGRITSPAPAAPNCANGSCTVPQKKATTKTQQDYQPRRRGLFRRR